MQIELKDDELVLTFPPSPLWLQRVRQLPSRRFDAASSTWRVPHAAENWQAMRLLGFPLDGITPPTRSLLSISFEGGMFVLKTPGTPTYIEACRRLPDYRVWNQGKAAWLVKPTRRNLEAIQAAFPGLTWGELAAAERDRLNAVLAQGEALRVQKLAGSTMVTDYEFSDLTPFDHQRQAFLLSRDTEAFALLMEQGTGKTKVVADTASWLFLNRHITGVLVIAPNSVKTNWLTDELPAHTPRYVEWQAAVWSSAATKSDREKIDRMCVPDRGSNGRAALRYLIMNVEALSSAKGLVVAERFLLNHQALMVVDESSRIKTPGAKRTRAIVRLGKKAKFRRIMTGTPVTHGPLDMYAQFAFLDPRILGFGSYYAFRNHFAIMGGFNGKQVVAYQHLDELTRLTEPYSFRVTADECLDLPERIYQRRVVEMTGEQRRLYDEMRDQMVAEYEGQTISVTIVLTQLLRLQQIAGGFLPATDPGQPAVAINGANPKIDELLDITDELRGKAIVWARFRGEIDLISQALRRRYGDAAVVEFHGGVGDDARVLARTSFQDPASPVRFFVGQTETGGIGLTLTQARTVIYFSNSFSLESRLQSEKRAHRIGQRHVVTYIDLEAKDTVDAKIRRALRAYKDVADLITGDAASAWL